MTADSDKRKPLRLCRWQTGFERTPCDQPVTNDKRWPYFCIKHVKRITRS